jgi:hypothetical protein
MKRDAARAALARHGDIELNDEVDSLFVTDSGEAIAT